MLEITEKATEMFGEFFYPQRALVEAAPHWGWLWTSQTRTTK